MNERIFKNVKRILAGFGACLLSFSFLFVPVLAYGSNVDDLIAEVPVVNLSSTTPYALYTPTNTFIRARIVSGTSNFTPTISSSNILSIPVSIIRYKQDAESVNWTYLAFYNYDDYPTGYVYLCFDNSSDNLIYGQAYRYILSQTYQYNQDGVVGINLKYAIITEAGSAVFRNLLDKASETAYIPSINYTAGVTANSILAVISSNSSYKPWQFSTSSGGRHWADGTTLDSEDTSEYSQIFIVMDSNNDKSVTENEVNYYNYTYNTSYDYSQVNENQNFNQDEFLYWVAQQINNGVEDPGGGTGSGGGSGSVGGGITVTDSFTQSQTQSIAENAVNVSITNNNSFDPENVNNLNSVINNNIGNQEGTNAINEAVYNINLMTSLARKISSLIGIILGFLPWWASTIVGLMFSILAVMVVFRLIHLFI